MDHTVTLSLDNDEDHTRSVSSSAATANAINTCDGEPIVISMGSGSSNIMHHMSPAHADPVVMDLQKRLRYRFMNPVEKFRARKQCPYKLSVQIIKGLFITTLLLSYGAGRNRLVQYNYNTKMTLCNLFIKGWTSDREVLTYPPTTGPLAVYTFEDFYSYTDHAVHAYSDLQNRTVGSYFYDSPNGTIAPLQFCVDSYREASLFGFNESYVVNGAIETACFEIGVEELEKMDNFSIRDFLASKGYTIKMPAFIRSYITITLKTVRIQGISDLKAPDCYKIFVKLTFDNADNDGQILINMEVKSQLLVCHGDTNYTDDNAFILRLNSILDLLVIATSLVSLILCTRGIYRDWKLLQATQQVFRLRLNQELSKDDQRMFVNGWYYLIVLNDILIISGTMLKGLLEHQMIHSDYWDLCGVLLAFGTLLAWVGVLRYLTFFKTYNVITLTLTRAMPDIFRFMVCLCILYVGYMFCGWILLGPYHYKFQTLSSTSETLFSLINGDDMFATFAGMAPTGRLIWWSSRVYLYSFISLFIYVVLSLFIAVIMDAYESVKIINNGGCQTSSPLLKFISECTLPATSDAFSSTTGDRYSWWQRMSSWGKRALDRLRVPHTGERQPLLS